MMLWIMSVRIGGCKVQVKSVDAKGRVGKRGKKRKEEPKRLTLDDATVIWEKGLCLVGRTE
jgi:hypothetical protein